MQKVRSRDGTLIAFDQSGTGPALILVGGAFSQRVEPPMPMVSLLESHFTVFNYDRRGRGDSGDTLPYAVAREVEDIAAVLAAAGGAAFVFGMSSGAILALEAARHLAITKLAVYEPPFACDASRPPMPADYTEHLTDLLAADRRGDAAAYFMTKSVGIPEEAVAQMRGTPMWAPLEKVAPTLAYDNAIVGTATPGTPLPAHEWTSVTMPTLAIDGGDSPAWMRNAVQALVAALPNAQRRTLAGQTHNYDPTILAPVLTAFFTDSQA